MAHIGVDVSKKKLDVCWLREPDTGKLKTRVFSNDRQQFPALLDWLLQHTGAARGQLHVYLEATSIYHEPLAHWLHEAGACVYVLNPAQVRFYARSQGQRGKNDRKDSRVLAEHGAQKRLQPWQPEPAEVRELHNLLARLDTVRADIQREHNRREKAAFTHEPYVLDSIDQVLQALRDEERRLREQIDDHIQRHPPLRQDQRLLETIPGIGDETSKHLLVAMRGRGFTSARNAAAFFGLVPLDWESGSSVKAQPRLLKAGQAHLRQKLYMAAVVAIRHNPTIRGQYERLRKAGKAPMAALGAAMRKLVHIAFGVWRSQTEFRPQPE